MEKTNKKNTKTKTKTVKKVNKKATNIAKKPLEKKTSAINEKDIKKRISEALKKTKTETKAAKSSKNKKTAKVVKSKSPKKTIKAVKNVKPTKKAKALKTTNKNSTKKAVAKKATNTLKTSKPKENKKKARTLNKKSVAKTVKTVKPTKPVKKSKPKQKIALVLEGGGMRGAYTAGCLAWLIDHNIEFDGAYGISSGAVHLVSYLYGNIEWLKSLSTYYIPEKSSIGLGGLLKEGQFVAFDYKFNNANKKLGYTITKLKTKTKAKIGLYDLNSGHDIYYPIEEMNDDMLKAACSLPILSKSRIVNGHEYLDAGITDMIPVEEAIKDGYDKYLIITTKAKDYVRKKTKPVIVNLMKIWYKRCPNVSKDYAVRAENYYEQIDIINKLVGEGKAVYRYPTYNMTSVTRFGGETEDLERLYDLGYSDMEAIKEDIFKLVKQ